MKPLFKRWWFIVPDWVARWYVLITVLNYLMRRRAHKKQISQMFLITKPENPKMSEEVLIHTFGKMKFTTKIEAIVPVSVYPLELPLLGGLPKHTNVVIPFFENERPICKTFAIILDKYA